MNIHTLKRKAGYAVQVKAVVNPAGTPTGPALVCIENGHITEIFDLTQSPDWRADKPEIAQMQFWDYSDQVLCPGLIDAHIHVSLDGVDFPSAIARWHQPETLRQHLTQVTERLISGGIVLARDGGDKEYISFRFRQKPPLLPCPKLLSPGEAIRKVERYGSFLGAGVTGQEDIRAELHRLALQGVDFIKLVVTGIVSFHEYGKIGPVQFTLEELATVVREAHAHNLRVMAHVNGDAGVQLALQAGVDSIEHGYFMSHDTLRLLAEAQVPWIPTVIPLAAQVDARHQQNWSAQEQSIIRQSYLLQLDNIAYAHQQGAVFGLGSDAGAIGVYHGVSLHQELALLSQAGLSSQELFTLATQGNAEILGQAAAYGSLAPGKVAAMLVVAENPQQNLGTLQEPIAVFLPEL